MNLKPKERTAILSGQFPELVRPEKPEVDQEIVLKSQRVARGGTVPEVSIRVLSAQKLATGGWKVEYLVKDDRGLYASRTTMRPTQAYTRSPRRALDPEAPVLDPETIEKHAAEAVQASALLQAEHWRESNKRERESSTASTPRSQRAKERQARGG